MRRTMATLSTGKPMGNACPADKCDNAAVNMQRPVDISIVVPAHNPGPLLARCLAALRASMSENMEIIVVDDGSDESIDAGSLENVRLVRLPFNRGRGAARNAGVRAAQGKLIVFIDADVEVRTATLRMIGELYRARPAWVAFFGSYDDAPGDPGLVSQYRNLLHHFTHQTGPAVAPHFWTGLGAIRRDVFWAVGGFDETRWCRNMEEVEFGARLSSAGHVVHVVSELQAKHLKCDTLASMIRTDLLHRALPWAILMLEGRAGTNAFVVSRHQRASALGILLAAASLPFGLFSSNAVAICSAVIGFAVFGVANRRFAVFLQKKRGTDFLLACIPLHAVHTLCAVAGLVIALIGLRPRESRPCGRSLSSSK